MIPPRPESAKPAIYHCLSRAVNREFVLGDVERERQRMYMPRQDGARTMRGSASATQGLLWSARDLRVGVDG